MFKDKEEFIAFCENLFKRTTPNVDKEEARAGVLGHHPFALLVIAIDYINDLKAQIDRMEEEKNNIEGLYGAAARALNSQIEITGQLAEEKGCGKLHDLYSDLQEQYSKLQTRLEDVHKEYQDLARINLELQTQLDTANREIKKLNEKIGRKIITPARLKILKLIHHFHKFNKMCPTARELARITAKAHSTIHEHISTLEEDNYLEKIKLGMFARNYQLTKKSVKLIKSLESKKGS